MGCSTGGEPAWFEQKNLFTVQPCRIEQSQRDTRRFPGAGWGGEKRVAAVSQRVEQRGEHIFYW
jgi:hypothetical protein